MTSSVFFDSRFFNFLSRAVKRLIFVAIVICSAQIYSALDLTPEPLTDDSTTALPVITDTLEIGGLGPEMVVVPLTGLKVANCIAERVCVETITDIVRSMIASPYAISRYEITFDDYDRFCEATGRTKPEDNEWGRGSRPVLFVAWKDVLAYVNWLTDQTGYKYRLPSVIEWEHAARAGRHTAYWWGPDLDVNRANCSDCESKWSQLKTAPVGSFPPNPWGIYDMHGNVSEFTQDCAMKKRRFRISRKLVIQFSAEPRFFENCEWIRVKGSSWLSTYYSAFRRESDQNNPNFPDRWQAYPGLYKSAAKGIRVVREL